MAKNRLAVIIKDAHCFIAQLCSGGHGNPPDSGALLSLRDCIDGGGSVSFLDTEPFPVLLSGFEIIVGSGKCVPKIHFIFFSLKKYPQIFIF